MESSVGVRILKKKKRTNVTLDCANSKTYTLSLIPSVELKKSAASHGLILISHSCIVAYSNIGGAQNKNSRQGADLLGPVRLAMCAHAFPLCAFKTNRATARVLATHLQIQGVPFA